MSGVSTVTMLEVFTQPDDLEIVVAGSKENDNFAIIVTRGPRHDFKLLLSTEAVFESKEKAVEVVQDTLKTISEQSRIILTNPSDILGNIVNPDGLPVEEMDVLTPERIIQIIDSLNSDDVASTYKMRV